jgi:hypothetical protein
MQRGFNFVSHGGHYVLVSVVRDDITFSDPEFHKREATLLDSRNAQLSPPWPEVPSGTFGLSRQPTAERPQWVLLRPTPSEELTNY